MIAPEFNRELGLLENMQLLIILTMFVLGIRSYKTLEGQWGKLLSIGVILFAAFLFLEEVDYGLHIFDYLAGRSEREVLASSGEAVRNLHNQYDLAHYFKMFTYLLFIALILILPFAVKRFGLKDSFIARFTPSHYLIYTLLAMELLNQVANYFDDHVKPPEIIALDHNISEFEEFFLYYIMLLYTMELMEKMPRKQKKKI